MGLTGCTVNDNPVSIEPEENPLLKELNIAYGGVKTYWAYKNGELLIYTGEELFAGMLTAKLTLSIDDTEKLSGIELPEKTTYRWEVKDQGGYMEVEKVAEETFFWEELQFLESAENVYNFTHDFYRGGEYTSTLSIPELGKTFEENLMVKSEPMALATVVDGESDVPYGCKWIVTTGYPFDTEKFTSKEKATVTLLKVNDDETTTELKQQEGELSLVDDLRPQTVARIDSITVDFGLLEEGQYKVNFKMDAINWDKSYDFKISKPEEQ